MKKFIFVLLVFIFSPISNALSDTIYIHDLSNDSKVLDSIRFSLTNQGHTVYAGTSLTVKHDPGQNIFDATKETLIKTGNQTVDWVIYIGHGESCSGEISSRLEEGHGKDSISPETLRTSNNWKDLKGLLIFGCAVLDIGDSGKQQILAGESLCAEKDGNYCFNYFNNRDVPCSNSEFPDPGLKWAKLAEERNIQAILGFNFRAPNFSENGGYNVVNSFMTKWLDFDGTAGKLTTDNFIKAWKEKITSSAIIERSYIVLRKEGEPQGNFKAYYAIGVGNGLKHPAADIVWQAEFKVDVYKLQACKYGDVSPNSDYSSSVIALCKSGAIKMPLERLFYPGLSIKRVDFIKALTLTLESEADIRRDCNSRKEHYSDIDDSNPYLCYVKAAIAKKILDTNKDKLLPNSPLTRAEAVKLIANAYYGDFKSYTGKPVFTDVPAESWFFAVVQEAHQRGHISGYTDKTFKPTNELTRAEAIKLICSVKYGDCSKVVKK